MPKRAKNRMAPMLIPAIWPALIFRDGDDVDDDDDVGKFVGWIGAGCEASLTVNGTPIFCASEDAYAVGNDERSSCFQPITTGCAMATPVVRITTWVIRPLSLS